MSNSDEITLTMTVGLARTYVGDNATLGPHLQKLIRDAVAEHDATQNPLALPWGIELIGPQDECCVVITSDGPDMVDLRGWRNGDHLTEAQARLMSAAPELANALLSVAQRYALHDGIREQVEAALKKAGRK